jgi:hypothetical protein
MALAAGEYEFTCGECKGTGTLQYVRGDEETGEAYLDPGDCCDCDGEGTVTVDEQEAAEWIEVGHTPLRAPADS